MEFARVYFLLHFYFPCILLASMFAHHVCAWYPRRPEESDRYPKIGVTVNCHVGAENQTFVLWKSSQCSLLFISPSPQCCFLKREGRGCSSVGRVYLECTNARVQSPVSLKTRYTGTHLEDSKQRNIRSSRSSSCSRPAWGTWDCLRIKNNIKGIWTHFSCHIFHIQFEYGKFFSFIAKATER